LRRNAEHQSDPNVRFHYRYLASSLAWEAAKFLPDNTDESAYALWLAGSFLKHRDPQTADFFYKALVRRNRKTRLGAEADRQRWFPALDDQGNIVPKRKVEVRPELVDAQSTAARDGETDSQPASDQENKLRADIEQSRAAKGYDYVIHAGDSVAAIAEGFTRAGVAVTPKEILLANPNLDPARIKIGQTIFVPASAQ